MYSWDDDMSNWNNPTGYSYSAAQKAQRAANARLAGNRTYSQTKSPDWKLVSPKDRRETKSRNPLVIGVDVTASMAHWPFEIFDRLPLLFNTLSQYRQDLEIAFVAIGDARAFDYPLQASGFGQGAELEAVLKGIYPEGVDKGSIDNAESYGLLPYWMNNKLTVPDTDEKPFLIVFGDITMHPDHTPAEIKMIFGDEVQSDMSTLVQWQHTIRNWNTWFMRSPRCQLPAETDAQWSEAIGAQKIVHIEDEQRAVDYVIGLISRSWGHFDDFRENMSARQDEATVDSLAKQIESLKG